MFKNKVFTESKINTNHGPFNIRVYSDLPNKETVVLYTKNLDISKPVLVRIHSECLTGDIFGSLQCDCGNQLNKSLDMIKDQGGVLIYLRQEGRGIGLFEKIKAYELQHKGYDTFESNVLLGHLPDERTYEKAEQALSDLDIKQVRLITNNPNKISEIAKFGIEITERVPMKIKGNKSNEKYLKTKNEKFQHYLEKEKHYYYQLQPHSLEDIDKIAAELENKIKDPFIKIYIGIYADKYTLEDAKKIEKVRSMQQRAEKYGFVPSIHFSFRSIETAKPIIKQLKDIFPSTKNLHLNDLKQIKISDIEYANSHFSIDLALDNSKFDIIKDPKLIAIMQQKNNSIIIDNSKGKGKAESFDSYKEKIDFLLSKGLNNICLCGGFGPNELNVYFELRRYYRINFSIDAESKLKTNNRFDHEKGKEYLFQLLNFDNPRIEGIKQTLKLLEKRAKIKEETTTVLDKEFIIDSNVFHPGIFPSSAWFATELIKYMKNPSDFCEIGCGSGIISCHIASSNPKTNVCATDINIHATNNTRLNADNLSVGDQVQTYNGDVLDPIPKSKNFDYIFWLLPFGLLDSGTKIDLIETQVFDPGYRATAKFLKTAKNHLKKNGKILIGFSSDLGHPKLLEKIASENNITLQVVSSCILKEEENVRFELIEGTYI